jgi:rubrerythrin
MPIGTLLLGLALLIIVAVVVALPLLGRKMPAIKPPSRREALEQERRAVISAIRELDFDHRTGKIAEEDYKRLREAQVARGAQILRELDALNDGDARDDARDDAHHDVDAEIEAEIARLRTIVQTDRRRGSAPTKQVICPSCGYAAGVGDKFCPQCGHRLGAQESSAGAMANAE